MKCTHLGGTRKPITRFSHADVEAEFPDVKLSHGILRLVPLDLLSLRLTARRRCSGLQKSRNQHQLRLCCIYLHFDSQKRKFMNFLFNISPYGLLPKLNERLSMNCFTIINIFRDFPENLQRVVNFSHVYCPQMKTSLHCFLAHLFTNPSHHSTSWTI